MPRPCPLFALLAVALLLAPSPAAAQLEPATSDPVVARVDGAEIRLSDVADAARRLPEQFQGMPTQILYPLLIDQLISETVVTQAGRRERLHETPELRRQLARLEDRLVQQALIARAIDAEVTEAALRERYRREIAEKPAEAEVRARHILVATETEARAVLADLARGADFAALARQLSRGPGAAEGGDLGFLKRDEMPDAFAEAAFALAPGRVSAVPVRTQFGWHVIKVEERREQPRPTFEEAREELRRAAAEDAAEALIRRLRAAATIERFALDGAPLR